jgi:hypothetical protein
VINLCVCLESGMGPEGWALGAVLWVCGG